MINPISVSFCARRKNPIPYRTPEERTLNPHNLVNITTAEEVGKIAKRDIQHTVPYRIATAGYSAPPANYEQSTEKFLNSLMNELGRNKVATVTSPTADKGSIDAITSSVTGLSRGRLFYTTAQDYTDYINPKNFPPNIDTHSYSRLPKYVLPNAAEYSRATAEASNVFIATGGRNATVSDFVNAIKKGNSAVILVNPKIDAPAWGAAKNRVEDASKYLREQISAFRAGKELPHPEVGGLTKEFLEEQKSNLGKLVRIFTLDNQDVRSTAKKVAKFIRAAR